MVEDTRIAELLPAGGTPATPCDHVFDAHRHVVLPGLINTHHPFFQTLAALKAEIVEGAKRYLRDHMPVMEAMARR